MLKTVTNHQLRALSEISLHVLSGNLDMTTAQKSRHKRHVNGVRLVTDKKATVEVHREMLTLPLVAALLSVVRDYLRTGPRCEKGKQKKKCYGVYGHVSSSARRTI